MRSPKQSFIVRLAVMYLACFHVPHIFGFRSTVPTTIRVLDQQRQQRKVDMQYAPQRNRIARGGCNNLRNSPLDKTDLSPSAALVKRLSPLEEWCAWEVEQWYEKAVSIKCPFFRRRMVDALDGVDMMMRFLVIRHKSLDIFGPPPGHRSKFQTECSKTKGLSVTELVEIIRSDWSSKNNKGYYITGNLNTAVYRDDCLFDGPDPDMPVRGLRKYLNAASQLFDRTKSQAELLLLTVESHRGEEVIVAKWRLQGVLRLPWKPSLPEWTGRTIYHLDQDGLVYIHEEHWDMSVAQAFMETFVPDMAKRIWPSTKTV